MKGRGGSHIADVTSRSYNKLRGYTTLEGDLNCGQSSSLLSLSQRANKSIRRPLATILEIIPDLTHSRMSLFNSMLLLLFLAKAHFGEPASSFSVLKDTWHEDELAKHLVTPIHWANAMPCPERQSSSGTASLKATPSLLGKRQEHQMQSWQGMHPMKSRVVSIPQEALLVEREKDLSTYNWNSFGLRYGKRQAVKAKMKI